MESLADPVDESAHGLLLLTLRDPQFADRTYEVFFCGPPQLGAKKWARGITSASVIFRGELAVSICSRLMSIHSSEGVAHRRGLHELGGPADGTFFAQENRR
jgi:hypothetical protein